MMRYARRTLCVTGFLVALVISLAGAQAKPGKTLLPSDAAVRKMLADRVDRLAGTADGIGIVVGLIGPQGRRVISYGHARRGDRRLLDGDDVFEIASVTKVFTALLLADMVERHEVALTDPVAEYLPAGVTLPERNGRSITLVDLATHTSSLPFMPDDSPAFADPAAAKDPAEALYQFLAHCTLARDIGSGWDYSNLGYWLLGQALAARAAMPYDSLLERRVLAPLHLTSTANTPSRSMSARLTVGHNAEMEPAAAFSSVPMYGAMAGILNMVSTANDLLTLLAAQMGYERSPLAGAMAAMLATRRPKTPAGEYQALGWVVAGTGDEEFVYHDGGALGYASSVVWDPKKRVGVVVLANQVAGVADIARHLLRPNMPLATPTSTRHTEIVLATDVLDMYAGSFEAKGEGVFTIAREESVLTIQLPNDWGLPALRLRPETRTDFFTAELPLRVTFQLGGDGRVTGILVHPPRGQQAVSASRIGSKK